MFVGHYGPGMGLKRFAPKVPLWVFFLAVQWVDVLWSIFILTGVEKARLTPGFTEASPLDLYYMPYTHSLTASIAWACLAALVASRFYDRRGALAVGIAVLSHWILDLPVHVADLPLYGNLHKVGFGLWRFGTWSFVLEAFVLLGGAWLYGRAAGQKAARAIGVFALALLAVHAVNLFLPPPPSMQVFAVMALVTFIVLAWLAARIERRVNIEQT